MTASSPQRQMTPWWRPLTIGVGLLVLAPVVLVSCADESEPSADASPKDALAQEQGHEHGVDWSEGLTQEEQLAEIEFVVSVMQDHFGDDVAHLDGDEWDLERFANWPGFPTPSYRADGHYFYEVTFDMTDVEGSQETQEKALAVLDELGLSPNGEQPTTYDEDRRPPLDVTGGRDDNGRIFRIEQLLPDSDVVASFMTRHSDHESMHEAHEASWE